VTLVVALLGGLLIGGLLAVLGAGGSVLAVPVLVVGLGLGPYAATTGSLVVVGSAAAAGAVVAVRRREAALDRGLLFAAAAVVGAVAGATASSRVAPGVLLVTFALLLAVVAVLMLVRPSPPPGDLTAVVTLRPWRCDCPRLLAVVATATAVGFLTGFLGVGGGFLVVPALVVALGLDLRAAVGTSLAVIALTSAVALATRLFQGAVLDWAPVLVLTAVALGATLLGRHLATRVPLTVLRVAFPVVLLLAAGLTLWQGRPGPA
jgi:uncharacterized membrane protein YfcA